MTNQMQKKTPAEAAAYREEYRKATSKAVGVFQHFATAEQKEQHEQHVKQHQDETPF